MKRLNIIFIADEGEQTQPSVLDNFAPEVLEDQVNLLNSMLNENPSLAQDKGVQELIELGNKVKADQVAAGIVKEDGTENVKTEQNNESDAAGSSEQKTETKEKSPLSGLPFFKDEEGNNVDKFKTL